MSLRVQLHPEPMRDFTCKDVAVAGGFTAPAKNLISLREITVVNGLVPRQVLPLIFKHIEHVSYIE